MRGPGVLSHRNETARTLVEVVLADVRSVVRKGLALVISREPDMELLFEASSADEAVSATVCG
jgi:DNA-binding NarL/FixJ family response regulator